MSRSSSTAAGNGRESSPPSSDKTSCNSLAARSNVSPSMLPAPLSRSSASLLLPGPGVLDDLQSKYTRVESRLSPNIDQRASCSRLERRPGQHRCALLCTARHPVTVARHSNSARACTRCLALRLQRHGGTSNARNRVGFPMANGSFTSKMDPPADDLRYRTSPE